LGIQVGSGVPAPAEEEPKLDENGDPIVEEPEPKSNWLLIVCLVVTISVGVCILITPWLY
jgi:hypothetical protein